MDEAETKAKVLNWMMAGQVGASSKAMAAHLCGMESDGSYPLDPDDLNRCLLLLDAVPELRAKLPAMATLHYVWDALVDHWEEIETSFVAEAGLNWCKGQSAPNTYGLMRAVIDLAHALNR